jgi:hypothetical protein
VVDEIHAIEFFIEEPGRYVDPAFDQLARQIPKPHEPDGGDPWVEAFFAEMEHIAHTDDPAAIGGAFDLVDQDGRKVSDRDLKGRPFLAFFSYTRSPDVCPATLFALSRVMHALGPDADRVGAGYSGL